jgi:hypothetical protein
VIKDSRGIFEGLAVSADGLHLARVKTGFFALPALLQAVLKMCLGSRLPSCVREIRGVLRRNCRHQ